MKSSHLYLIFAALVLARTGAAGDQFVELTPHWIPSDQVELSVQKAGPSLEEVAPENLPSLMPDGNMEGYKTALRRQIIRCKKQNLKRTWNFAGRIVTRKVWCVETAQQILKLMEQAPDLKELWTLAKTKFRWYRSTGLTGKGDVKFTGYYLPRLRGSRTPNPQFTYPLYRRPPDLVRVKVGGKKRWRRKLPDGSLTLYPDRREIDWDGFLEEKNLEIVYVDDHIEAFFMHIQGSGTVIIQNPDGSMKRLFINYAGANGRGYTAIGRILRKEGKPKKYLTLQGLRLYFTERPWEVERIFPMNPSYIFFEEQPDGPYGSGATVLVPEHSIATDNGIFPLGASGFIVSKKPIVENGQVVRWVEYSRMIVNQDTGGAIRTAGRVDVFWGEGEYAEFAAGGSNHMGDLYFALAIEN